MEAAKSGDRVKVHYTGKLDDGTVFDSSQGKAPLEFTLGNGQVIPGFETGIIGMQVGETKAIHIPVDQAYGPYKDEYLAMIPLSQFPADIVPKVGEPLSIKVETGDVISVMIKSIEGDQVILDANHPLAGKNLNFDLTLESII